MTNVDANKAHAWESHTTTDAETSAAAAAMRDWSATRHAKAGHAGPAAECDDCTPRAWFAEPVPAA